MKSRRVTVATLVADNGRYLLVEEDVGHSETVFNQPAGHLEEGEREELILELTHRFNFVLDALIIDRYNDPNSRETGKRCHRTICTGRECP